MSKKYEHSHPWLTFGFDTREFSYQVWILLGAAQSKCRHIEGIPLDATHAQELHQVYLVKGMQATTAIEGNTLSEEEVRAILDNRSNIPPSRQYQEQEIRNILDAYNSIVQAQIEGGSASLSVSEICEYNSMVLKELELEDGVVPGVIRSHPVVVGQYRGAPAEDCPYLLNRLCDVLNGDFSLGDKWNYASGILKAIIAHLYLAWIHPFGDGNGRTARLVELKICASSGIAKPACQLLSNFYNKTRDKYYRELDTASRMNTIKNFIEYALQGMVDMLDEQIAIIREYQIHSTWENYVHKVINGHTLVNSRRRNLALELYNHPEGILRSELKNISPKLAREYLRSTSRKLTHDIYELRDLNLIRIEGRKIFPNIDTILAWLPRRKAIETS